MTFQFKNPAIATCASLLLGNIFGCCSPYDKCGGMGDLTPRPMGAINDEYWRQQESNAEASDFVVYEHEWSDNSTNMNDAGKEHLKQIAVRAANVPFPVIIERSSMSTRAGTKYKFPVHNDEELDLQRRTLVVSALAEMGVPDAEQRVVVSPALTPGFQSYEAERAYSRGFNGQMGGGGFGGMGGGGFGGMGGGGGMY